MQALIHSTGFSLVIAILALAGAAATPADTQKPTGAPTDLHGKLYRSVFFTGPDTLSPSDLIHLPEPVRTRLSRYLARRSTFASAYLHTAGTFEEAARDAKKRDIERAIVSLVDVPDVTALAANYVRDAEIRHAWSGSQAPLAEAEYARTFVEAHADSPLAPYLHAFIAQRQRAAFEMLNREKNAEGAKAAAFKYRDAISQTRAAADRIFTLLADDLDARPFLFINVGTHPRDVAGRP